MANTYVYTQSIEPLVGDLIFNDGGSNESTVASYDSTNHTLTSPAYPGKTFTRQNTADKKVWYSSKQIYIVPVTVTINPVPADATVTLTASGYTQEGNSITVDKNTTVSYTVTRTGYNTQTGTITADSTKTVTVNLSKNNYTFTVSPTPADATVTLTASGYTQSGNSITVPYNTTVNYSVAKSGYTTKTGSLSVTQNQSISVKILRNTLLYTTVGNHQITLDAGTYYVYLRGGGGSGGMNSSMYSGGAGAPGEFQVYSITLNNSTNIKLTVGDSGKPFSGISGVLGEAGAGGATTTSEKAGAGGNSGKPSWIQVNNTYYIAQPGAGGGGAGGGLINSDETGGEGGGGGGAFMKAVTGRIVLKNALTIYFLSNGTLSITNPGSNYSSITIPANSVINTGYEYAKNHVDGPVFILTVDSISGTSVTFSGKHYQNQYNSFGTYNYSAITVNDALVELSYDTISIYNITGRNGAPGGTPFVQGGPGIPGNVTEYPNITSGKGGDGGAFYSESFSNGGPGASGAGASGGGGGGSGSGLLTGAGGGGAGGSPEAGGGASGSSLSLGAGAESASNHYTTPTDTTTQNATADVSGNYGQGGAPESAGVSGFVVIKQMS